MLLRARYLDLATNAFVEREFESERAEALRDELGRLGHVVVWIRTSKRLIGRQRAPAFDLRGFCLELRALLSAGLGVVGSLEALASSQRNVQHRAALSGVLNLVTQGKAFSVALESAPEAFPSLFRATIRAGESSGHLPESLGRFADYLETMARLRQRVLSASIYPSIVVAFGLLVMLFLLGYVVPRFAAAYETLPQGIGASAGILMTIGQAIGDHFQLVLAALLLTGWFVSRWLASQRGRMTVLRGVLRLGPIAGAVRAYHLARVFRTLAMMLEGGYTMPEAMAVGGQVVEHTPWAGDLTRAREWVERGKSLLESFESNGMTNEITRRLIAAGMQSGRISEMLNHAAEHHERELATFVDRASRVVEPVLLILVAVMIGAIVLIMYTPIFDLAGAVGQ